MSITTPSHFRRWVAPSAAPTFRQAAELKVVNFAPPREDEVVVRTLYATINAGHDTFMARREGRFSELAGVKALGADSLGQVVAVGSRCSTVNVGDYVTCVFCASYSEYTTPKEKNCRKIQTPNPDYLALRVAGTYAVGMMEYVAKIEKDKTLLVLAACGGVGHVVAQIAKINGCVVIGTCGNAAKEKELHQLGLDRVIDYNNESVEAVLKEEYPAGVDYVVDGVGGELQRIAFDNLAPNGKLLVIGFISMYPHTSYYNDVRERSLAPELPSMAECFWSMTDHVVGNRQIICNTWPTDPEEIVNSRDRAHAHYHQGELKPIIDQFALENLIGIERVPEAVEYMLSGKNIGKMLIRY